MRRVLVVTIALALALPAVARSQCGAGNGNSTKPACIALVGLGLSGAADPVGAFTVTVRDNANNPCPGSEVRIDFTDCVDLRIAPQSDQPYPGMIVDCTGHSVRATADGNGVSRFCIVGAATNPSGAALPRSLTGCARATADDLPLGTCTVQAFNEDGSTGLAAGVGGNDLSAWKGDFFTAGNPYYGRSDFDCNGAIGGNDLAVLLTVFFAQGSVSGPSGYCP